MLTVCEYLMETSVIHYEFAALAVEKALQALELMLRTKVDPASRLGMSGLILALHRNTPLSPELREFLNRTVRLRNDWVGHPRNFAEYPMVVAMGLLSAIFASITELAEM